MEVNLRDRKLFLSAFKYYKKSLEEDTDVKIFLNLIHHKDIGEFTFDEIQQLKRDINFNY